MTEKLTRRTVLTGALGAAATATLGAARKPASWSFVHITDTHIQPELGAARGVKKAFDAVRHLPEKPQFALVGGDLVMDANAVSSARADLVYDLWRQAAAQLHLPLHYSIGNHDLYGLNKPPRVSGPDFGKAIWKRRLGLSRTYGTFDHRGWRFITLDSVGLTPDSKAEGFMDTAQISWLDSLLRHTPKTQPIVLLTHYPLMTIFMQYTSAATAGLPPGLVVKNGKVIQEMIQGHNVKAVFQGHTHVVENCTYLGTQFVTGGAVCGDWWRGPRLGVHPEGFVAATVTGETLTWRYVPYGWKAEKA